VCGFYRVSSARANAAAANIDFPRTLHSLLFLTIDARHAFVQGCAGARAMHCDAPRKGLLPFTRWEP
jgi:hypothetical protein